MKTERERINNRSRLLWEVGLMANKKGVAFFEAGSWYHRIKILQKNGTTKYSKRADLQQPKKQRQVTTNMKKNKKRHIGLTIFLLLQILI